jgi:hypothetical protein
VRHLDVYRGMLPILVRDVGDGRYLGRCNVGDPVAEWESLLEALSRNAQLPNNQFTHQIPNPQT